MIITLLKVVIALLIIIGTTFGWRPTKRHIPQLTQEERASLKRMKETVRILAEEIGNRNYRTYENLEQAAEYISQSFQQIGYEVRFMTYQYGGKPYKNIIATLSPSQSLEGNIIIGAHYDSCFNPGADDNASGVAGLLELARLLKSEQLKRNIQFVAFVNEEPPFFYTDVMGSRVFAKQAKADGEKIDAVLILEMIGYYSNKNFSQKTLPFLGPFYPHRANFIAIVGNFPSIKLTNRLHASFKRVSHFPVEKVTAPSFIPGIYFSDHWSFWKEGYPAVMITDTAFLRSSHYHDDSDLPDTLNYEQMTAFVHAMKKAVVDFSN